MAVIPIIKLEKTKIQKVVPDKDTENEENKSDQQQAEKKSEKDKNYKKPWQQERDKILASYPRVY